MGEREGRKGEGPATKTLRRRGQREKRDRESQRERENAFLGCCCLSMVGAQLRTALSSRWLVGRDSYFRGASGRAVAH